MNDKTVIIIGGGVGGLTVAHELAERGGYNITIYEKNTVLGGKARSMMSKEGFPGEHSVRTVSLTYYHLQDTLRRIPFGNNKTVFENIVRLPAGSRKFLLFEKHDPVILPCYFPWTLKGIKEVTSFIKSMAKIVPYKEILSFVYKLAKAGMMCPERRFDVLENMTWDDYLQVADKSAAFRYYLHRLPEFYDAARGNANAKSMSMLIEKALFLPLIHPIASQYSTHDVFNAPSSDAFINPWVAYLQKLGVTIRTQCEAQSFSVHDGKVKSITMLIDGKLQEITADIYVFAVPAEIMAKLANTESIKTQIPSLAHLDKLHTEASSGIQFFNMNSDNQRFPKGWTAFLDSPWTIVGLYQSKAIWPDYELQPPVKGVLTLTWSNFDVPGVVYNKPAKECTAEEIKEEVLAQVRMHKGTEFMDDLNIHSWHIDPEIVFAPNNGPVLAHKAPLFVQFPGTYQYQPDAFTEADNLFLAADYVRTTYDLTTMEAANEAGRRAVNAILVSTNSPSNLCFVRSKVKTGFGVIEAVDKLIYKLQNRRKLRK